MSRGRFAVVATASAVVLTLPAAPAATGPEPALSAPEGRAPQPPVVTGVRRPPPVGTSSLQDRTAGGVASPSPAVPTVWDRLADCESNGDWDYGPHSGWGSGLYEGGLQFHPSTWDVYRPAGYPDAAYHATREQQIAVAERVLTAQGWRAWPACSRRLGLRGRP